MSHVRIGVLPARATIEEARRRAMGRELHFWTIMRTYQCPDPDHPHAPGPEYHVADSSPVCLWCGADYDITIKNQNCLGGWEKGAIRA